MFKLEDMYVRGSFDATIFAQAIVDNGRLAIAVAPLIHIAYSTDIISIRQNSFAKCSSLNYAGEWWILWQTLARRSSPTLW